MRGLISRAAVASAAVALLGSAVAAANTGGTARASVVPGRNGKIVVGQVFPNFGFTINPERLSTGYHRAARQHHVHWLVAQRPQGAVQPLGPEPCSARDRKPRRVGLPPVEPGSQAGSLLCLLVTDRAAAVVP